MVSPAPSGGLELVALFNALEHTLKTKWALMFLKSLQILQNFATILKKSLLGFQNAIFVYVLTALNSKQSAKW